MSNKSKSQQHQQQPQQGSQQQQQQHHQQQQHQQQSVGLIKTEPLPPRYQPPPQPNSGILKSAIISQQSSIQQQQQQQQHQGGGNSGYNIAGTNTNPSTVLSGAAGTATLNHHHQQQLHQLQQQHQQQAARLASQVKDAVQSKFAQKVDLPHTQPTRSEKLQSSFPLHQGKNFLPTTLPTSSTTPGVVGPVSSTAVPPTTNLGIPNGIPLNGQIAPRQRISDDEFLRLGPVEMLKFVRKTESDIARLAAEQHRQIQSLINELRMLKEANQRLSDDNQELRDLCCFLDDDRQKGRKLAREWQRFGRYTASVMRQEVSAYQNKLRQLDNKQQELIKDNLELKELCLYLDEERSGTQRDDGDGSSSSTNADETAPAPPRMPRHVSSTFNDQTMQYVRSLEQRVKQLEEDKSILQARTQGWPSNTGQNEVWDSQRNTNDDFHLGSRPEAVVRALQVLEVREQLEREAGHDGEKALVREMCNVVWRKLEEGPTQNRH